MTIPIRERKKKPRDNGEDNGTRKVEGIKKDPETGRFLKGTNGAGRKVGSRNKLGAAFLDALCEDFDKHGVGAIKRCRINDPVAYVKTVASLLPRQVDVNDKRDNELENLSDSELTEYIEALETQLRQGFKDHARSRTSGAPTPTKH